jgi:hypothetical protein
MGGLGGGGGTQVIQTPAPPPNPDADPSTIAALAQIYAGQYQTEISQPTLDQMQQTEQAQIPLNYGVTGFFPEQQQEYAQTATAQVQNLASETSVSAEIAAQQSMFQAGMANLQAMTSAATQRAQLQAANYAAYAQQVPTMAMGMQNLFGQNQNQQQQQFQAPESMPGQMNLSGGIG